MTMFARNSMDATGRNQRFGDDEGAVALIVAVTLALVLLGIAVLVVDVGSLFAERRKMQTTADAAALAGVQELPTSSSRAISAARAYAAANAPSATDVSVAIVSGLAANDTCKVTLDTPNSPLFFARIWNKTSSKVGAKSTARVTSPLAYGHGVMPFGILATGTVDPNSAYGYSWGTTIRIKEAGGSGTTGNFGLMSLPDPPGGNWGASDVRSTIAAGGTGWPVYSNTLYSTATGNKTTILSGMDSWIGSDAHTFSQVCKPPDANGVVHTNLAPGDVGRCHRLIVCPVVVSITGNPYGWPNGRSDMRVIGFLEVFVTAVGSTGNDAWIDATIVRTVAIDELVPGAVNSSGQVHYALTE